MTRLANIERRQKPRARRVIGLFAVLWLNLALQPCAMAMGGDDNHDCNLLDTINVDGGAGPVKLKDLPSDLPVAILPSAPSLAGAGYGRLSHDPPLTYCPLDNSPRLNILYCVYLK